jgi:hypothetical protein
MSKRKTIPKAIREEVWDKYIGKERGVACCFVCKKREIRQTNFEVGHVKSIRNGGSNNIGNLRPLCFLCNRSMGTKNLHKYKKKWHKINDKSIYRNPKKNVQPSPSFRYNVNDVVEISNASYKCQGITFTRSILTGIIHSLINDNTGIKKYKVIDHQPIEGAPAFVTALESDIRLKNSKR